MIDQNDDLTMLWIIFTEIDHPTGYWSVSQIVELCVVVYLMMTNSTMIITEIIHNPKSQKQTIILDNNYD